MSKFQEMIDDDLSSESVEVLRERLNTMKRLMAERNANLNHHHHQQHNSSSSSSSMNSSHQQNGIGSGGGPTEELWTKSQHITTGIIDGNFLSIAFGGALIVIITVSVYAFYNLYHAILKKFPSHHTEL